MTGEKDEVRVDVWLLGFEPTQGEPPTEALRRVFRLDAQQALTLELTVPTTVQIDVPESDGARMVLALRDIGGQAEARPTTGDAMAGFELYLPASESPPTPSPSEAKFDKSIPPPNADEIPRAARVPKLDGSPASDLPPRRSPRGTGPRGRLRPEELQVADVGPGASRQARFESRAPTTKRAEGDSLFTRVRPLLAAALVGVACLAVGLYRGESAFLGTGGDPLAIVLDGLGLGALMWLLVAFIAVVRERSIMMAPGLLILALGGAGAYGLNVSRRPAPSEYGGATANAEELVQDSGVHFYGFEPSQARAFVTELRESGALSVDGVGVVSAFGVRAVHGLHIRLSPGPISRQRVEGVVQRVLPGSPRVSDSLREWTIRLGPN